MKRLLVASLCVGFSAAAFAADVSAPAPAPVYLKAPAAASYSWAGLYGGANAGWVGSTGNTINLTGTDTGTGGLGSALLAGVIPLTVDLGYSGFLGGGQFGYNWQAGNWVFGLEADLDWASAKSSANIADFTFNAVAGLKSCSCFTTIPSLQIDWLDTFRGRVGFTPRAPLLLYATGGLAVGRQQLGIGFMDPTGVPPANLLNQSSSTSVGWTVGAGAEWMFAPHWSLRTEYLYVDLGDISSTISYAYPVANTSTLTATIHDRDNVMRGSVNYHF